MLGFIEWVKIIWPLHLVVVNGSHKLPAILQLLFTAFGPEYTKVSWMSSEHSTGIAVIPCWYTSFLVSWESWNTLHVTIEVVITLLRNKLSSSQVSYLCLLRNKPFGSLISYLCLLRNRLFSSQESYLCLLRNKLFRSQVSYLCLLTNQFSNWKAFKRTSQWHIYMSSKASKLRGHWSVTF